MPLPLVVAAGRRCPTDGPQLERVVVVHILLLVISAAAIYLACEWFVNAVEWLGARLQVGTIAVGSVLAAIGTALPESVVTLVAVTFGGGSHGDQIGIGAAMGGPLALSTIAYGVTGGLMLIRRGRHRATAPSRPSLADPTPPKGGPIPPSGISEELMAGVDMARLARDRAGSSPSSSSR